MVQDQKVKRSLWSPVDNEHGIAYDSGRNRITFRIKTEGHWFNIAHLYLVDKARFLEFLKDNLPQALTDLFKKDPVEEAVEKLLAEWQPDQTLSSRDLWAKLRDLASPVMETLLEKGLIESQRSQFDVEGNLVVFYSRTSKTKGTFEKAGGT